MTLPATPSVRLTGWGRYAPAQVLTNADLERMVDTSDEWIVTRTGIRERRVAAADETTASMAAVACAYGRATGTMPTAFPVNHGTLSFEPKPTVPPIPASPTDGLDHVR